MTARLRNLLVAAVVVSTVLVGMRDAFAAAHAAAGRTCSIEAAFFHGSREDDSGLKSEEVEEDDVDEEQSRDLSFLGVDSVDCRPDAAVGSVTQSPICRAANLLCRDALVRGPPARG